MRAAITLEAVRAALMEEPDHRISFKHSAPLLDAIEERMKWNMDYKDHVNLWLDGKESTVFFRDTIAEPLRYLPQIVKIGLLFNPSTEWHNTWIPLDTAAHIARTEPERIAHLLVDKSSNTHYDSLPNFGIF